MRVKSGYPYYGQTVGVLVFNGKSPRIPGDAGHAGSYNYQVRYQLVNGSFADLIDGSPEMRENMLDAARTLKAQGVRGIVGDCGLMSLYQQDVAAEVGIPFAASSLCQIPLVWQMIGRSGKIGIITGHSALLKETHLRNSGWTPEIPLVIQGMECMSHFAEIVINGGSDLIPEKMEANMLEATRQLLAQDPDIRAIILECSNLGSFSWMVAEESGLPVFDVISAANLLEYGLEPPQYY